MSRRNFPSWLRPHPPPPMSEVQLYSLVENSKNMEQRGSVRGIEAQPQEVRRKRKRSRSRSRSPSCPRNKNKQELQVNGTPPRIHERSQDARTSVSSNGLEIARQNSTIHPDDGKRMATEMRTTQGYHSPSIGRNLESMQFSKATTSSASKKDI